MILTDANRLRAHPSSNHKLGERPGVGAGGGVGGLPQAAALRLVALTPGVKSVPLHALMRG